MSSNLGRRAYYISNRLMYAASHYKNMVTKGNRTLRLHPGNDDTKSIFVHIPKTGGFSVAKVLYGVDPWHYRFSDYQSITDTSSYFTFSIVRHPALRLASMYGFLQRRRAVTPQLADCKLAPDFRSFLEEYFVQARTPKHPFLYSQSEYILTADGSIGVDFLGKMESLAADFEVIKSNIGSPDIVLPHLNKSPTKHRISDDDQTYIKAQLRDEFDLLGYS